MPEISMQNTESKPKAVNLTDNAVRVLQARYLKKNEDGKQSFIFCFIHFNSWK